MPSSGPDPTLVTPEVLRGWILPEPTGGKNARGSILVIGGSTETLGAVLLAAEAAMRAGAGKLQVATVASLAPFAAAALPEALVRALPETQGGAICAGAADVVRDLAEAADAVLIGPGMADTEETQAFGERLLPGLGGPLVLDALGLACVTADESCLLHLTGRVVLTPNPTEIAISLHVEEGEIEDDPAAATLDLAGRTQAVVGLGGATSWIAAPWCRTGAGGRLGGLSARPHRGAAGVVGRPARLPRAGAAAGDSPGAGRGRALSRRTAEAVHAHGLI
jgi:ADP-dependent NAD(P)H-hydrate dehydratase